MNSEESIKRLKHIIEVVKDKKASNNEYLIDLYDAKCLEELLNQNQQLKEKYDKALELLVGIDLLHKK